MALLVAGAWVGVVDVDDAAAVDELPFPTPVCASDLPDAGNPQDGLGVGFYQPHPECLWQNSMVDGSWSRVVSVSASPSVVYVGEDGIADVTLNFNGSFSREYDPYSYVLPPATYSLTPTWDYYNGWLGGLQYANAAGKFTVGYSGYSPWTLQPLGSCRAADDGPVGPAESASSCTIRIDTSAFPLESKTALMSLGVRYGLGTRYYTNFPNLTPTSFRTVLMCDGGGLYWCLGGGSNPSRATPLGVAWTNVKLIGPGAEPENTPPVAAFDPPARQSPGVYQFVSSSFDEDAGDALNQVWDFGDGSPIVGGPAATHTYTKPGTFTATLIVTDTHGESRSTTRQVVVDPPQLYLAIVYPDHETDRFTPDEAVTARVHVVATDDGVGPISDIRFDGPVMAVTPDGVVAPVTVPSVPLGLTLQPGDFRDFDVVYEPVGLGKFELRSTISGTDAAGHPQGPRTATKAGNVSALKVSLDAGGVSDDAFDVTMTVQNLSDAPVTGITYPGGGLTDRSVLVPEPLRGAVGLAGGPTPALPDTLGPGQTVTATFHYVADQVGTVVLVGEAQSDEGGGRVSGSDDVQVDIGRAPLTPTNLRDLMDMLAQSDYQHLSDLMFRLRRAANERVIAHLQGSGGTSASAVRPASSPDTLVPIDNAQLLLAALDGTGLGVVTSAQKLWDFGVANPLAYYSGMWNGGQGAAWQDYVDAGVAAKETADTVAFGTFSATFQAYDVATSELNDGQAYTDLTEAMIADNKQRELLAAEIQPKVDAFSKAVDDFLARSADKISTDPEGFAHDLMAFTSEGIADTVMGEALTIGGVKMVEKGAEAYEYSRFGTKGKALRRLSSGETLESLGAGAAAASDVERLGGITQADQGKIQKVIREMNEEFGVDLEIQARPSNPYSVEFLNRAEGALPKPEVFKAKNISDVDVALGADPAARGQLGVFEPKLPPESKLKSLDPGLAQEIRDRFETQSAIWKEWNDPSSKFAKSFQKASQEGGHTFQFATPTEAGGTTGFRDYHIEVSSTKMQGTTVTITESSGRPIVSDIDFHAYITSNGKPIEAGKRAQIELELQRRWKREGIAYGDHGATLNGYDWPGLNATDMQIKRQQFLLEFSSKEEALRRAEEISRITGVPVSQIMKGFQPGKYVIKFQADSTYVGHGAL